MSRPSQNLCKTTQMHGVILITVNLIMPYYVCFPDFPRLKTH